MMQYAAISYWNSNLKSQQRRLITCHCQYQRQKTRLNSEGHFSIRFNIIPAKMPYFRWIILAFDIGPILVTIIGNSTFLITIWNTKSLHTASNTFFVFLSITDLIAGLTCQPLFIALLFKHEDENQYLITTYNLLYSATCINSLLCVLLISLNRLFAVACPIKYRNFSSKRKFVRITLTAFTFSSILSTFEFMPRRYEYLSFLVYFVMHMSLLIVILASHCGLFVAMRRRKRICAALWREGRKLSRIACRIQRQTTKSIAWVTFAFLLCFVPYLAYQINHLLYFTNDMEEIPWLTVLGNFFILLHSALNPLVCFATRKDVRIAAWRLVYRNSLGKENPQVLQS